MDDEEVDAEETRSSKFFGGVHHPWRRLLARTLDMVLIGGPALALAFMAVYAILPQSKNFVVSSPLIDFLYGPALCFEWIPIEAGLLSMMGTTPGKSLFGIGVRADNGEKLSFGRALKRASLVVVVGAAFYVVHLVTAIMYFMAYRRLTETGVTEWDKTAQSTVTHKDWSWLRLTMATLIYLGMIALIVFGDLYESG